MALKGLTAQDRANWEQQFHDRLLGRTPQEVDNAWVRYNVRQKYGNRPDYAQIKGQSVKELEDYWNTDYDTPSSSSIGEDIVPVSGEKQEIRNDATTVSQDSAEIKQDSIENQAVKDMFRENSELWQQRAEFYKQKQNKSIVDKKTDVEKIKELAYQSSNWYKKYMNTDYIQFDDNQWADIASQFKAYQDAYGDDKAIEYLQKTIYNEVDRNTSWVEDNIAHASRGMAMSMGEVAMAAGSLPIAIYEYKEGMHDLEGLNEWERFHDALINNQAIAYAHEAKKWGTFNPEKLQRAKELGIAEGQIIDDWDVMTGEASMAKQMFNKNTIAHALDNYGFSAMTMFLGAGTAKIISKLFRGWKALRYGQIMTKTAQGIDTLKKVLKRIQRVENFAQRTLVPGIIGQLEGMIEGHQTTETALEEGLEEVNKRNQQEVDTKMQEWINDGTFESMVSKYTQPKTVKISNGELGYSANFEGEGGMTKEEAEERAYKELFDRAVEETSDNYNASLNQAKFAAAKAGIRNYMLNSAINGVANYIFKATIFGDRVRHAMRSSWLGRALNKPKIEVDVNGKASGKISTWRKIWEPVKEASGEFIEESLQYASDTGERAGAANNLATFLDCKYGVIPGQEDVNVGKVWYQNYAAARAALGKSFMDSEMYLNGYYGALGFVLGGLHAPKRARLTNGKKAEGIKGVFQKGVTVEGKQENWWDVVKRISPWRSGVSRGLDRLREEEHDLQEEVDALQTWLDDPKNRAKFHGINGTMQWANGMKAAAEDGDEFGYRNSAKGKAINDAIMLQKLQGTEFYNAIMGEVEAAANLTMSSKEAPAFIEEFRTNLANSAASEQMTDEEVVEQIKKNALQMKEDIASIQKKGDEYEELLGNINDDTKESLIYGSMMIEDWGKRGEQIESDLRAIDITPIELPSAGADEGKEQERVLSEKEILALDPVERAKMIANPSKYSAQQQKIIENLTNQGVAQDIDFIGKIRDASRIIGVQQDYMRDFTEVIKDPDKYGRIYGARAKMEAMRASYKQRYDAIKGTEDYEEFSTQMDKLLSEDDGFAKATIMRQLERDEKKAIPTEGQESNYARYKRSRQEIADIVKHAQLEGKLGDLEGKDIDDFIKAVSYLTHRGVDIHDGDAVSQAMLEVNEQGSNDFMSYYTSNTPIAEGEQVDMTPEKAITLVHDVVGSYDKEVATQTWKTSPVEVVTDAQEASKPAQAPGVFATAATRIEDTDAYKTAGENGTGTVTKGTTITETGATAIEEPVPEVTIPEGSIVAQFKDRSAEPVIKAALQVEELIKKSDLSQQDKEAALGIIEKLGETPYLQVADFINAFNAEANKQDIEGNNALADKMRAIASRTMLDAKEAEAKANIVKQEETDKLRELSMKSALARQLLGPTEKDPRDAANLQTLDIDWLKSTFSTNPEDPNYSPLLRYIEVNGVEEYLVKDDLDRDIPVYFIFDPQLAQEQREFWAKNSDESYTRANMPLIPCVKVANGPVVIDGEHYQPIGIMPGTGRKNYFGTNRLGKIREYLDESAESPMLVSDSKGVIETRISNHVYAKAPMQLHRNISILEAGVNGLTSEDTQVWNTTPVDKRKGSSIYQKIKKAFVDTARATKVQVKDSDRKRPAITMSIPNLKGDMIPVEVFFPSITDTKGVTDEKTVGERLREDDSTVLTTNSRFKRWANAIKKFAVSIDDSEIVNLPTGELSDDSYQIAEKLSEELNKVSKDFLFTPKHSLKLLPGDVVNGKRQFTVYLSDGENNIQIGIIQKGDISQEQIFSLLKDLILDENGEPRKEASGKDAVIWQVSFNDFTEGRSAVSKDIVGQMFDDGIFEVSKERLNYVVSNLTLEAPYTLEGGKKIFEKPNVTNKDNATTPTDAPVATNQVEAGGAVIDTNTGTVITGKVTTVNKDVELAKKKAQELSEDTYSQTDSKTYGKNGQEHWNPYTERNEEPSSPEESLKEQVKDMFRQLVFKKSRTGFNAIRNLTNMTAKALANFEVQVNAWKNRIEADGVTLLPKEVLATWHTEGLSVATPIGLGYDAQGNWKAFIPVVGEHTKVDEQMAAMLAQSIEKEYGVTIKDYSFVEISAQMPKGNNIQVSAEGQITTNNSHRYDGARPTLSKVVTVPAANITTYQDAAEYLTDKAGVNKEEVTDALPETPVNTESIVSEGFVDKDITPEDLAEVQDSFEDDYIPASQEWGVFKGKGLNAKKTVENLEANGITEEKWILMSEQEREQELECKGIY